MAYGRYLKTKNFNSNYISATVRAISQRNLAGWR